jgi:hypothetical protein
MSLVIMLEVQGPTRKPSIAEQISWLIASVILYISLTEIHISGLVSKGFLDLDIVGGHQGRLLRWGFLPILLGEAAKYYCIIRRLKSAKDASLPRMRILIALLSSIILPAFSIQVKSLDVNEFLIYFQVAGAQIILVLWSEILSVYSVLSGLQSFNLVTTATQFTWGLFWIGDGSIIGFLLKLFLGRDPMGALHSLFYWNIGFPTAFSGMVMVCLMGVFVYISRIRIELPLTSLRIRGRVGSYPLYMMDALIPTSLTFALLATMKLLLLIAPSLKPLGFIFGLILNSLVPLFFIKLWREFSALSSRKIAADLKKEQLTFKGFRDASLNSFLDYYISPISNFGGVCLSIILNLTDIFCGLGRGTCAVIATISVLQLLEIFGKEGVLL